MRVVREGRKRGGEGGRGEGESVKVSTVQEDHQAKTKLVMETQKKQEASKNGDAVKVSDIFQPLFIIMIIFSVLLDDDAAAG